MVEGQTTNTQQTNTTGPVKRQTAFLCTIAQLNEGEYVKTDGWDPSYLESSVGALSRVRLAGLIVETGQSITLDDGTGSITIRSFDVPLPSLTVGNPVLIVGRPRLYDGSLYVLVETCKVLPSPDWLKYYKEHLREWQAFIPPNPKRETVINVEEKIEVSSQAVESSSTQAASPVASPSTSPVMELITLIRELDPGDGASVDDVLAKASFVGADEKLQFLISEGEVFELRAGKVKVLE